MFSSFGTCDTFLGVKIKIKGKGKVKWSDLVTSTDAKGKIQFVRVWRTSDETYLKTVMPLDPQEGNFHLLALSSEENSIYCEFKRCKIQCNRFSGKFMLPLGQYLYPFSMTLPSNLPASFIGLHGRVLYYAKATVMFESRDNAEKKIFFRVRNILNLNNFPALKVSCRSRLLPL